MHKNSVRVASTFHPFLAGLCCWIGLTLSSQAFPLITNVVETGGDNEATDTVTAKWTGVTFSNGVSGEFLNPYTVPVFGEDAYAFVDRSHQWNGATVALPLPSYLVGGEYIMIGNDNRDNANLRLDITISEPALVYLLVDNRLGDTAAADPPHGGLLPANWPTMSWVGTNGFQPVLNGLNRTSDPSIPDEVGIDGNGDGVGPGVSIADFSSVYRTTMPAGTFSFYQADNAGQNMYGIVVKRIPGSTNEPPVLASLSPTNNALFASAGSGLHFTLTTIAPNSISPSNITLILNGVNVSSNLVVGGPGENRAVAYSGLVADTPYRARIIAIDQAGRALTNDFVFDTFSATSPIVEAEDYNYASGNFLGAPGSPSAPNAYANLAGVEGVDYHDNNGTVVSTAYRPDFVGIVAATDVPRQNFVSAGATDYQVTDIQAGEWLNFTRPDFATNAYKIYLRAAASAAQSVRLDRVIGGATTSSQSVLALGTFPVSAGGYAYAPLSDGSGKPVVVNLGGTNTLRLTALNANVNLQLNYLLFVPVAAGAVPPYVSSASPAPGANNAGPDAVIQIQLADGSTAVAPGTVSLTFNGSDVTGSTTITPVTGGASVSYDPPGLLPLGSTNAVQIIFGDTSGAFFTNVWSFTIVSNLLIIPSSYGTPPGSGQGPGFLLRIHKARDDAGTGTPPALPNTTLRAEQQLAGQLIDPLTGAPYANEAGGPAGDGVATNGVINFEQAGNATGYFAGDVFFPYLDPAVTGVPDPNNLAMLTTAYLELAPGVYRFGVRSDDGFKLTVGPVLSDTNLVLGMFEGGRGNGLPGGATEFNFLVQSAGVYPFRLLWYEGNGGANLEFYSVDRTTFQRTLINDPNVPGSIKAFVSRSVEVFTPTVTITSPTNGGSFATGPTNVTVTADASVTNGQIARVEFFYGVFTGGTTNKFGEATTAPFSATLSNLDQGHYTLMARATDTNGLVAVSPSVGFLVGQPVISINFQAATTITPAGYLADTGEAYGDRGNGHNYGWDVDNTINARERNSANSPDKRYDTFNHMLKPLPAGRVWEIEITNGVYKVEAVSGDPDNFDSVFDLQAENVTIVSGAADTNTRFFGGTGTITVSDGRLTLSNGPLAANSKVNFIDLFLLSSGAVTRPTLTIDHQGGNVVISWAPAGGTLEAADDVTGPYVPIIPAAPNPATIPIGPGSKFFRVSR